MSQVISEKQLAKRDAKPFNPRIEEQEWLAQHQREYPGTWVALQGSELLAVGPTLQEVRAVAKLAGHDRPLLHHISEEFDIPFGGW